MLKEIIYGNIIIFHVFHAKKTIIETQTHILYCDTLLGKNENVTVIPQYEELYSEDLREQV